MSSHEENLLSSSFQYIDEYTKDVKPIRFADVDDLVDREAGKPVTKSELMTFKQRFDTLVTLFDSTLRMSKYPFLVLSPRGIVLLCSPSVYDLLGYTFDELMGNNISMLMAPELAARHDDILANYARSGHTRISSVVNNTRPVIARHKDGRDVPVMITVKIARGRTPYVGEDGKEHYAPVLLLGQLRDASNEVKLRNAMAGFTHLEQIFPFPYIEADEFMTITKFNPAASRAFGLDQAVAVGKNVMILQPRFLRMGNGKRVGSKNHDRLVSNYVSKVRAVGKANVESNIVDKKTSHTAMRISQTDVRTIETESFRIELEVRMQMSTTGVITFQAFARDCKEYMNAAEAQDEVIKQMLPRTVANEIIADRNVNGSRNLSVVFCDIVGFTHLSSMMQDDETIAVLNDLFGRFTNISQTVKTMDPIKTNYDEFMCVCGLDAEKQEKSGRSHAADAVAVGFAILEATAEHNLAFSNSIEVRVGISSGDVLCGLFEAGHKSFDVLGEPTVFASRAESTGRPNMVHITQATYDLLTSEEQLQFSARPDQVTFKNIGAMQTYLGGLGSSTPKDSRRA